MKRVGILTIVLITCIMSFTPVVADEHVEEFGWSTGTYVRLKAEIEASTLENGSHDITFYLTLVSIDPDTIFLLNSRVFILIQGEETMRNDFKIFRQSDPGTSSADDSFVHTFEYDEKWGEVEIDIKFYCEEFYSFEHSITHETNWVTFFTVKSPEATVGVSQDFLIPLISISLVAVVLLKRKLKKKIKVYNT